MPEEFDSIFKSRKGGPPPWIDQLAADPAGRQLYYQLTSGHRNCLLLNYAVQKILNAGNLRRWHRCCDAVPPADLRPELSSSKVLISEGGRCHGIALCGRRHMSA